MYVCILGMADGITVFYGKSPPIGCRVFGNIFWGFVGRTTSYIPT